MNPHQTANGFSHQMNANPQQAYGDPSLRHPYNIPAQMIQHPNGPAYNQPHGVAYNQPHGAAYNQSHGPAYNQPRGPSYNQPHGPAHNHPQGPAYNQPHGPSFNQSHGPSYNQPNNFDVSTNNHQYHYNDTALNNMQHNYGEHYPQTQDVSDFAQVHNARGMAQNYDDLTQHNSHLHDVLPQHYPQFYIFPPQFNAQHYPGMGHNNQQHPSSQAQNPPQPFNGSAQNNGPHYGEPQASNGITQNKGPQSEEKHSSNDTTQNKSMTSGETGKETNSKKPPVIYENYPRKTPQGLGVTQIVIGILCIVFNAVDIGFESSASYGAYGIAGGVMFIIAGSFGVASAESRTRCQIMAYMILCIISVFSSLGMLAAGIAAAIMPNPPRGICSFNGGMGAAPSITMGPPGGKNPCEVAIQVIVAMNALLAILGGLQPAAAIWGAVVSGKVAGYCKAGKAAAYCNNAKAAACCKQCKKPSKKGNTTDTADSTQMKNVNSTGQQEENATSNPESNRNSSPLNMISQVPFSHVGGGYNVPYYPASPLNNVISHVPFGAAHDAPSYLAHPMSTAISHVPFPTFGAGHHGSQPKLTANSTSQTFGAQQNGLSYIGHKPEQMTNPQQNASNYHGHPLPLLSIPLPDFGATYSVIHHNGPHLAITAKTPQSTFDGQHNEAPAYGVPNNGMPVHGMINNGMHTNGISTNGMPAHGMAINSMYSNGAPANGKPTQGEDYQVPQNSLSPKSHFPTFGAVHNAPDNHGTHNGQVANNSYPAPSSEYNGPSYHGLMQTLAAIPSLDIGSGYNAPSQHESQRGQTANISSPAFSPEYNASESQELQPTQTDDSPSYETAPENINTSQA